jgi:hypothetical protein
MRQKLLRKSLARNMQEPADRASLAHDADFAALRSSKAETTAGAPNDKHISIARNMYVHGHSDGLP